MDDIVKKITNYVSLVILENTDNVVVLLDKKGQIIFANKKIEDWLGYKKEELIGKNVFSANILTNESIKISMVNLAKRFLGKEIPPYKLEFIAKNGKHLYGSIKGFLIKDEKNNIVGDLILITDISEKEEIRKTYEKEKEKLESFFNLIEVIILILNTKGNIIFINKKGCQILENDFKSIQGKNWFDNFIPQKEKDRVKNVFNQILAGNLKDFEYFENYVITSKNKEKLISWHNSYLKDENNNIFQIIAIGEDITEKKQKEEELKRKTKELERLTKLMVGRELKMIELKEKLKKYES